MSETKASDMAQVVGEIANLACRGCDERPCRQVAGVAVLASYTEEVVRALAARVEKDCGREASRNIVGAALFLGLLK